jgi:hypothetical protein
MKILLVHGVGHSDEGLKSQTDLRYYKPWIDTISNQLTSCGFTDTLEFDGLHYDDLFDTHYHGAPVYFDALAELLGSAAWHSVTDPLAELLHPSRGFLPSGEELRWKAGMVAQLAIEEDLRRDLRDRLVEKITSFRPDVLVAHSLGSLITYDLFRNDPRGTNILAKATYITFGSQINNTFARSRIFPGQIKVPNVRYWYHLYNTQDPVLTAPIPIKDPKFLQVSANSPSGHSPVATQIGPGYLDHPNTHAMVWSALAKPAGARTFSRNLAIVGQATAKPKRRALLIGINDYPDPANRLEGCVNDVFLTSSLLQERGFAAEDIRVVLNERATAQGIRERLAWLLDGADDGMERVLFYSGHGAQMPGYSALEVIDHVDECLVPYDFAWTKETAITDDDFYHLYSELPYKSRFFTMFDCCHSGGMTRDGSRKVRGITPPDDIRHRLLEWNSIEQMWQQRKLPALNDNFGGTAEEKRTFMGSNHATYRLGRAMRLRQTSKSDYTKLPKNNPGPYLPVLIEACGEEQYSYEYRHGVTSYGAFTYAFAKNLRAQPSSSFQQALANTNKTLKTLGYNQTAQLVGPVSVIGKPIPGKTKK